MDSIPQRRHRLTDWIHKQDPALHCIQEMHLSDKGRHYLRVKGWKTILQANGPKKQAGVAILISNGMNFQPKVIIYIYIWKDTSYWSNEKSTKMNSQF
jgi:exonuclease III